MSKKNVLKVILLVLSAVFVVVKGISGNDYLLSSVNETE